MLTILKEQKNKLFKLSREFSIFHIEAVATQGNSFLSVIRKYKRNKDPIHKSNGTINFVCGKSLTRMCNVNKEKL
jgi:hypothetical protein